MRRGPPIRTRTRGTHAALWLLDHLLGEAAVERALGGVRRTARKRLSDELSASGTRDVVQVPRRRGLSPEAFKSEYLEPGLPVVLEGAAEDWEAVRAWTPEYFAEHYGDAPIQLINAAVEDVKDDARRPEGKVVALREVVDAIRQGGGEYPRFAPLLHEHSELRSAFDVAWLESLRGPLSFETMFQFFMGGPGTSTALHSAMPNNLFVQAYGHKRWWLFPPQYAPVFRPPMLRSTYFISPVDASMPDLDVDPMLAHVPVHETVLAPGDVLYNPPFWWHQVLNETATIGVGVRWFGLREIVRSSPTQALLTLLSTSPPVWVARANRTNFPKTFIAAEPHG